MKSITASEETSVGSMTVTFCINDDVYDYVVGVLSGKIAVPSVTVTEDEQTEQ